MPPVITLLTDFGYQDTYVAEVKAVLMSGLPKAALVDLTHAVPAFQIETAAFQLLRAHAHFPRGTWHLAIVDPGVGSERRGLYIRTRDYHFVGPDNGLLLWAARACEKREGKPARFFELPPPGRREKTGKAKTPVRPTFHGRDWFAPFLVRQASGPARLKTLTEPQGREFPACRPQGDGWQGEIIAVDHFGNLVTSIPAESSGAEGRLAGLRESLPSAPNYVSIPAHRAALIAGSHGFWEIACYQASAAEKLGVGPRTPVTVFPQRPTAD